MRLHVQRCWRLGKRTRTALRVLRFNPFVLGAGAMAARTPCITLSAVFPPSSSAITSTLPGAQATSSARELRAALCV